MASSLAELREQLRRVASATAADWGVVSSGRAALDGLLAAGGFRRGTLVEWFAETPGSGATQSALLAARQAVDAGRPLVVVDRPGQFHPPAVVGQFDWRHTLLVRPARLDDARWACDQALRTPGVGAVVAWVDDGDERWLRRWQLAAETGGALGLVIRHMQRLPEACFSDVRLRVRPLCSASGVAAERRLRWEVLRCRQGGAGAMVEVSFDDDAYSVSPLVAVGRRRAAGA